ncbi:MAG: hypothetical protein GF329_07835 [Candidatus Lokiarchaeota archaeon]|nr:hypothetical protein [Candidatus Lokiarchaeota archaeon]
MNISEVRKLIFRVLKDRNNYVVNKPNQMIHLIKHVTNKAKETGSSISPLIVQDEIWALIIQGILAPGVDLTNPELPFFHPTEYGQKCLENTEIIPHDPEGYLEHLEEQIPDLDNIAKMYIGESLNAFRVGCYIASTVMLGCASEKIFLILIDNFSEALSDPNLKSEFDRKTKTFIAKIKYDQFNETFEEIKHKVPKDLKYNMDVWFDGIFNLIRKVRNESGHPTGTVVTRDEVYSYLQIFVNYAVKMHSLIEYFQENKI